MNDGNVSVLKAIGKHNGSVFALGAPGKYCYDLAYDGTKKLLDSE